MAHETAHIAGHDPLNQIVRNLGINAIARIFGIDLRLGNVSRRRQGNLYRCPTVVIWSASPTWRFFSRRLRSVRPTTACQLSCQITRLRRRGKK
ncbi:hypothetical protein [Paraburkholderia dinghuensis]|uniref:Uncharacterized protein n=1 Tax=Paraburkholderia dinghuensis TaxID=2305225 RepID=A0A3N6MT86_9BURK|nr:hypothetical protein D1Y85_24205 [Paraburkholderia dinghuensis]